MPKPKINNEWDNKYYREGWSFPFGSIMNAYAQMNQGRNMSPKDILDFAEQAYQKSQELIDKSFLKGEDDLIIKEPMERDQFIKEQIPQIDEKKLPF